MKKLWLLILSVIVTSPVWADCNLEPILNRVNLILKSEQWITTKTALVSVAVNAAVNDQGIEKIQNDVMQKLLSLSVTAGDWHITSFERQQDKTGLETIQIMAQARLPQVELAGLRSKAKSISKPGETITIDSVQFTPSDDEMRAAKILLRNAIYQQVKTEIDTLNKLYPEQKFYLHTIDFDAQGNGVAPAPAPMELMKTAGVTSNAAPLMVGNKLEMRAFIGLASAPDSLLQKAVHN